MSRNQPPKHRLFCDIVVTVSVRTNRFSRCVCTHARRKRRRRRTQWISLTRCVKFDCLDDGNVRAKWAKPSSWDAIWKGNSDAPSRREAAINWQLYICYSCYKLQRFSLKRNLSAQSLIPGCNICLRLPSEKRHTFSLSLTPFFLLLFSDSRDHWRLLLFHPPWR